MKIFKKLQSIAFITLLTFAWSCIVPYSAMALHVNPWDGVGGVDFGDSLPAPAPVNDQAQQGQPPGGDGGGALPNGDKQPVPETEDSSQKPQPKQNPNGMPTLGGGCFEARNPSENTPKPGEGSETGADPVYLHSGEFYYYCTDLYIPGRGLNVAINHLYRSGKNYNGQFGYGWTMSYYYRVRPMSNGNAIVISENGRQDEFTYNAGVYEAPAGVFRTLVQNVDGSWSMTRPNGTKYEFDIDGKLTAIVDRHGNQITFQYNPSGAIPIHAHSDFSKSLTPVVVGYDYQLTKIIDTVGREIDLNYNSDGKLSSIVDYAGRTITFTYDANSAHLLSITKPTSAQYPAGLTKSFTYDTSHNMLTITDAKSQVFLTNTYDSEGRVERQDLGSGYYLFSYGVNTTTVTDRRGMVTTYNFDGNAALLSKEVFTQGIRTGDPASYITSYTYNSERQLETVTYPEGNGVKYVYDITNTDRRARGNVLQVRQKADMALADNNTNDIVTDFIYESNFNQVRTITDPKGNTYTYTFDYDLPTSDPKYGAAGNVVKLEQPTVNSQTPTTHFTYNAYGQITETQNPNGNITQFAYHATTGYLKDVIRDPSGINAITSLTYDTYGNVDTITDANTNVTDLDYNELGWLIKTTNDLGYETKYTYDQNGNVTKLERQADDPVTVWQTIEYTYDILNNVLTMKDPLNRTMTYTYDLSENVATVTDAETNVTTYVYDERDLLFEHKDANTPQGVTQYDYDKNGNLVKITDAESNATDYAYDGFDRRTSKTYADSSGSTYQYDKNSNLTKHTTPSGNAIDYVYDVLNRRTDKTYTTDSNLDVTYTYDVGSRLTDADTTASSVGYTYDALNRVATTTQTLNSNNYTLTFNYDDYGNRTKLTYPSGKVVDYAYDDLNRMTDIDVNTAGLLDYTYDPLNRRTKKSFINTNLPVADYDYDIANQLLQLKNDVLPSTNVSTFDYTYDNVSNRLTMTTGGATQTYAYNDIYELTGVTGAQTHSYAYDNVGNRTTADSASYTSNNLNQYDQVGTQTYTYDSNDNLQSDGTNTYTYDEQNRLIQMQNSSHTATYEYDAFNRRVSKTVDGTTTYFVYDGSEVIEEYSSSNVLQADYVMGRGIDEVLTMDRSSTTYYYHFDGLNSIRNISNSSGTVLETYDYDPYGKITTSLSSIGNPYYFTGRRFDTEIGIYHYRARAYDPDIGRFLQRDPLGYYDSMNLFEYVLSNPINFTDPLGLQVAETAAVAGAAGTGSAISSCGILPIALLLLLVAGVTYLIQDSKKPKYWQYYPAEQPWYKTKYFTGPSVKPPYKPGLEAQTALNLPTSNPGTGVRPYKPKFPFPAGPRHPKPQPQWEHYTPGWGVEWYDGPFFPE